jgi:hypothetical protein
MLDDPLVPAVQTVYWLDTTVIPSGDPEEQRAVVVVAAPDSLGGTVIVVSRSASDEFGVEHGADRRLGLSTPGRFSRRHPVPCQVWTSTNVTRIGRLDDATFAAVLSRFGR